MPQFDGRYWILHFTEQECRSLQVLLFQVLRTADLDNECRDILHKLVDRGVNDD